MININCDLCGKIDERLFRALIEEVELNVCSDCSKFGKIVAHAKISAVKSASKKPVKKVEDKIEKIDVIVENYAQIIKKKRESIGLSQKDFANKINEKESIIHKIETGTLRPSLSLAKKLEKLLELKLVEEHAETFKTKKRKDEGFTLGDFINIKDNS